MSSKIGCVTVLHLLGPFAFLWDLASKFIAVTTQHGDYFKRKVIFGGECFRFFSCLQKGEFFVRDGKHSILTFKLFLYK